MTPRVADNEARDHRRSLGLAYLPANAKTGLNVETAFGMPSRQVLKTFAPLKGQPKAA